MKTRYKENISPYFNSLFLVFKLGVGFSGWKLVSKFIVVLIPVYEVEYEQKIGRYDYKYKQAKFQTLVIFQKNLC